MSNDTWTDERLEALKTMWGEGLTSTLIAERLGGEEHGITRNAVMGKVHRLGLQRKNVVVPVEAPEAEPESPSEDIVNAPVRVQETVAIPRSNRVSVMELRTTSCRWPIGDPSKPDFSFCGKGALAGKPYCTEHAHIAFVPNRR